MTPGEEALTRQIREMDMRYKILAAKVELAKVILQSHAESNEIAKMVLELLKGRQ